MNTFTSSLNEEEENLASNDIKLVADRLNQFLEKAHQIDQSLSTLETISKQQAERTTQKLKSRNESMISGLYGKSEKTKPLKNKKHADMRCDTQCPYYKVPKSRISQDEMMEKIMAVITQLRKQVSDLATRQNELKTELDYIRARVC